MPELVRAALRAASRNDDASNSGSSCPYAAAWSSSSSSSSSNEEKHDSESSSSSLNKDTVAQSIDPAVWDLARTSCPAFSDSCPFSTAKNATDVRQTLLQLPSSHWQASYFYQALQHLHLVVQQEPLLQTTDHSSSHSRRRHSSSTRTGSDHPRNSPDDSSTSNNTDDDNDDDDEFMGDDSEQYRIPGGCPIKHYTTQPLLPPGIHSFGQAMEECSLAAIMARMAKELEEEEEEQKAKSGIKLQDESMDATASVAAPIPAVQSLEALSAMQEHLEVAPPPPPLSTPSLAQALKTGTAASHEAAEHVHFVRNFIRGAIDRDLYAQLVLSLYHVYHALEDLLDQHAAHFETLHFPQQLHRTAALREDVDFWWGSNIPTAMTPATRDYVTRLHQLAEDDPVLLVAHAYTRYLGDLSGGRILARVAKKALHLDVTTDDDDAEKKPYTDGLAFYHFEHVPNPKQFKDTYRQALDQLPSLSTTSTSTSTTKDDEATSMIDKLVLEANVAFLLNMRLFEELDVMANVPGAQVRPMQEALEQAAVAMKSSATTNRGQGGKQQQLEKKQTTNHTVQSAAAGATGAAAATTTCPFAHMGKERPASTVVVPKVATTINTKEPHDGSKRCPWPFVFFHDPVQGLKDWQTWCVVAVIAAWAWTMSS